MNNTRSVVGGHVRAQNSTEGSFFGEFGEVREYRFVGDTAQLGTGFSPYQFVIVGLLEIIRQPGFGQNIGSGHRSVAGVVGFIDNLHIFDIRTK